METNTSCNTSTLSPYNPTGGNPWNTQKVYHIYNRLENGASREIVANALLQDPQELIDNLLSTARFAPNTPAPEWAYWSFNDYSDYDDQNNSFREQWYRQATKDIMEKGLKSRMTFFWINHFVTQVEVYNHAPYIFQYWDLIQTHCLGNFKVFVKEMGLTPAMLLFLNGFENTNEEPNENYARELYELFTLGENNGYTQEDIENTSRALTGYNLWNDYGAPITFNPETYDNTDKTIFGQTGNWGYDDVINILFDQKADLIAPFICTKLYAYFVSPSIQEDVISILSETLISNDWDMASVLEQLFKSEHFFDPNAMGQIIKSPYDILMIFHNQLQFDYEGTEEDFLNFLTYLGSMLGQDIFQPIDVAGWQRDQDWINSSTLTGRWLSMEYMSWYYWNQSEEQFRTFAKELTEDSADPVFITQKIVDFFLPQPLYTTSEYDIATAIFKWEVPENYYEDGIWNLNYGSAPYQIILLIQHIFEMPQFQLK